jgi:hypothetical protein
MEVYATTPLLVLHISICALLTEFMLYAFDILSALLPYAVIVSALLLAYTVQNLVRVKDVLTSLYMRKLFSLLESR